MRLFIYCFFIILLLCGCECPPNLDTDKDYIPREASHLSIINLLDINKPINVYSMNILIKKLFPISTQNYQDYFKFQSGIVDFRLMDGTSLLFNTIIQTEKDDYYSILLHKNYNEIESLLLFENIDKSKNNLYLRFANFSTIDKVRFVVKSNLPQSLEYNLSQRGTTDNIAFPSIPFTLEVFSLPTDNLIAKIENVNFNLGNIAYFILVGDTNKLELIQFINKYSAN